MMSDFERVLAMIYTDPDFRVILRTQGSTALQGYHLSDEEIMILMQLKLNDLEAQFSMPVSKGTNEAPCRTRH
jgi:hypothetical protein